MSFTVDYCRMGDGSFVGVLSRSFGRVVAGVKDSCFRRHVESPIGMCVP